MTRKQKDAMKRVVIALEEIARHVNDGTITGPHILFPEAFAADLDRRAEVLKQEFSLS